MTKLVLTADISVRSPHHLCASPFFCDSSVREPTQVFQLLETLYNAFDEIAGRRRVFKVETIGDCYVAVAGLPEPRKDHAVVMARFSRDCQSRMNDLTKLLEVALGPDTGDLALRIGLHSGPVTVSSSVHPTEIIVLYA